MRNAILMFISAILASTVFGLSMATGNTTGIAIPTNSTGLHEPCVKAAKETCDMKIWPPGSVELSCVTPHLKVRWYDPLAKTVAKCYCEKHDLQDKWWDCFYMAVALCPQTEATIKSLHYQEWEVHRYNRAMWCLDNYKMKVPFDKMKNEFLKSRYEVDHKVQYIDGFIDEPR